MLFTEEMRKNLKLVIKKTAKWWKLRTKGDKDLTKFHSKPIKSQGQNLEVVTKILVS